MNCTKLGKIGLMRTIMAVSVFLLAESSHAQCSNPSGIGCWDPVPLCDPSGNDFDCFGIPGWPTQLQAVHMVLLHTGKIIAWRNAFVGVQTNLWDPVTQLGKRLDATADHLFCAGHVALADGRILAAGGDLTPSGCSGGAPDGINVAYILDPAAPDPQWGKLANNMSKDRWYPTCTVLANGKVLVSSGGDCNITQDPPELYDPATANFTPLSTTGRYGNPWYPFMFTLTDGRVLNTGHHLSNSTGPGAMQVINPVVSGTWTDFGNSGVRGGSAVLFMTGSNSSGSLAKIFKAGGFIDDGQTGIVATAEVVRENGTSSAQTAMSEKRLNFNITVLPDGKVLIVGGGKKVLNAMTSDAVYAVQSWNPTDSTYATMADSPTDRMYHSTALLMPDGRVLSAGGEHCNDPDCDSETFNYNADFFSPPYLYKSDNTRIDDAVDRPQVSGEPDLVATGSAFTATVSAEAGDYVEKACFIRPGSVTHSFNQEQRYISLAFSPSGVGSGSGDILRTVTAPSSAEEAPPGYYMLFFLNDLGYPSIGKFVRVWGIVESSITHSNFASLPGDLLSVDISWDTSIGANDVDKVLFYRKASPSAPFDPPITVSCSTCSSDFDRHHSNTWTWPCQPGYWYYEVNSSESGTTSKNAKKIFIAKTTHCLF